MTPSQVFFANFQTGERESILTRFQKLLEKAGLGDLACENKFVAVKIHFGEPGNLGHLRPAWAKVLVDFLQARGARVFLTDCNTLYTGRRKNALEHLDAAYENGFSPLSTGCQLIIADGLRGDDEVWIPIDGDRIKEAKIGRAIADADIIVSLNHFKMHPFTGMGGAIKNVGMGSGSRAGKMEMHSEGKPRVNTEKCVNCGRCIDHCAHAAISKGEQVAAIDHARCAGCGRCLSMCPHYAIEADWQSAATALNMKMGEYAWAVLKDKPHFHISLALDINPFCDCMQGSGTPVVPDVGMFASLDPVAIDVACCDMVNQQPAIAGSLLARAEPGSDHFHSLHPRTAWRVMVEQAAKMGLGSLSYELIEL